MSQVVYLKVLAPGGEYRGVLIPLPAIPRIGDRLALYHVEGIPTGQYDVDNVVWEYNAKKGQETVIVVYVSPL